MQKWLFFSLILFFISLNIYSQTKIDSILSEIEKSKFEEKKNLYLELINEIPADSIELLLEKSEEAVEIVKNNSNDTILATFYNDLGLRFYYKSNFSVAEDFFKKSMVIEKKLGNEINVAKMFSNIAVMYELRGDYQNAVENYSLALNIFENVNFNNGISFVYNNLGVLYQELGIKDKSLEYLKKSLFLKEKLADSMGVASSLNNLGTYFEETDINLDSALYYYSKSVNLYKQLNNKLNYAIALQNSANIYFFKEEYSKAIEKYSESNKIFTELNNLQGLAWNYRNLGQVYFKLEKKDNAIECLDKSIKISQENQDIKTEMEATGVLAELYYTSKEYQKSVKYYKIYNLLSDSIFNLEQQEQINELTTKYETSQMQYKIENLNKDNQINKQKIQKREIIITALIISIFLIILISNLLRTRNRLKLQNQKTILEQKVLRLQMNPHFISNALTSVQNYILENKSIEASDYLSDFSDLMRKTIKCTKVDYITLSEEIEILEKFLKIQQLRNINFFDYKISVDENLETDFIQIPPMLLQPFVENSIKHGFKEINYKGLIEVNIFEKNEFIKIEIIDNGVGISNINSGAEHISYSISITKERLKYINKGNLKKSSVEIHNKEDKNGTIVRINIPIII